MRLSTLGNATVAGKRYDRQRTFLNHERLEKSMNDYETVLKELRQQEEEIQFASFSNDTALAVGMAMLKEARKRGKPVAIDITRSGLQLFHFAMAGTSI